MTISAKSGGQVADKDANVSILKLICIKMDQEEPSMDAPLGSVQEYFYTIDTGRQYSLWSAILTSLNLQQNSSIFFKCQLDVCCAFFRVWFKSLDCSLPQATKVWGTFWNEFTLRGAEIWDETLNLLLFKKIRQLFELSNGTDDISTILATDHRGMTSACYEASESFHERFSSKIKTNFKSTALT